MKKIFILAFTGMVIISGCNSGNSSKSVPGRYTINGTISNKDSGWVLLAHYDSTGIIRDSARVIGHKFTFAGKVSGPELYYLSFAMHDNNYLAFFMEDTAIEITANKDSLQKAVVSGSRSQAQYEAYNKIMAPFKLREKDLWEKYSVATQNKDKAQIDSLDKISDQLDKEEHAEIITYAQSNPSSVIAAWVIVQNMLYDPDLVFLKKAYASFTPGVQQSQYGKQIKKTIDITERLAVGKPAPDFTMNDTTGKAVSLSSFRGKFVLVDFWASWCHPCRNENPNVVKAYEKFKNKNFTILGVSFDSKKENWVKAVNEDNLTWTQVCDLKGWKSAACELYGIRAIPSNILIGPDGKIVARNLRGDVLEETLAKTLN